MVRYNYSEFEEQYKEIIKVAAGRKACTVLILVAFDVDAMASARMLTQQLRRDDITYERVSVMNFDEVKAVVKGSLANEDHDIKTVFLINCGAVSSLSSLNSSFSLNLVSIFRTVRFMTSQSILT